MARGPGGIGGAISRNIGVKLVVEGSDTFIKVLGEANDSVKLFSEALGGGDKESFGSLFGKATTGASAFSTALGVGLYGVINDVASGMWDAGKQAFNLTAEFEKNRQTIIAMTAVELLHGTTQKETHEGFMKMSAKQQEELQQKSWDYDQLGASIRNAEEKLVKMGDEGKNQTAQYLGQQATVEELTHKYQKLGEQIDALAGIEGTPYTYTTEKQVSTVKNMDEALVEARKPATEMIDRMTKLALISPFNRKGIMSAVEQGKAFGMTLVETEGLVTGLTKFATVSGRTESHINRITYAIGQTKSMGKVMMRQVRQMNLAGLSVQDMAASMGMGVEKFNDEVGKGNIHFTEFRENLSKFLENTYDSAFNSIQDSFRGLKNALGDIKEMATVNLFEGILEAFKPIMAAIVHPFTEGEMLKTIKTFGDEFGLVFKSMFGTVAGYIDDFMLFFTNFVGRISNPLKIKINLETEKQQGIEKQQTKYDKQMAGAMEGGTQYSQEYMNNLTYLGNINKKLTEDTKKQTALQAIYNTGLAETASQLSYLNGVEKKLGNNIWLNGEKGKRNMEGEAGMYWEQKDAIGALNAQNIEYRNTLNDLGVAIKNGTADSKSREEWQIKMAASGESLNTRYRDLAKSQRDLEAAGKTATPMYREQAAEMLTMEANAKLYIESHGEFMKTQDANLKSLQAIADMNKEAGASVPWLKAFRDTLRDTREEGDPLIVIFDGLIVIFDKIRKAWEGATNPTGKSLFTQLKEFFSEKILTALANIVTFIANNIDFIIIFVTNVAKLFAIVAGYGAIAAVIGRVLGALGFLLTPFGILLTIVGGLSKAYEINFGGFKTWIDDMKPILSAWVETVKTKFKNLFTFGPEYSKSFNGLKTTLGLIVTAISDKIKKIVPTPAEMQTRLTNLGTWIDYYFTTWKAKVMSWLPSTESIDKWVTTVQDIFRKFGQPTASTSKGDKMAGPIYDWKDALLDVQLAYGVTETKAKEVVKNLADNLAWFTTKWAEFKTWLPEQWEIIKGKLTTTSDSISDTILGYFTRLKTKIVDFFALDIFNAIKTVWNYKSEGKSGIEKEYEDAMKRLETYFGTKKFEGVIQFGTNIESVITTTLSRIKTFFEKEVPKAMADAFKVGFNQGPEARPEMDAQVKAVGEGLQVTPEVAKAIVAFIELVGEKFRQWAHFAETAYTNTKLAVDYLYLHRDAWFPSALSLTAALSIFTIGSFLWVSIGKFWTASGLAASTEWVGGMIKGLAGFSGRFLAWGKLFMASPSVAMTAAWTNLGNTWAVRTVSGFTSGTKKALTSVSGFLSTVFLPIKNLFIDLFNTIVNTYMNGLFGQLGTQVSTFSEIWATFSAGMAASGGWIVALIILLLGVVVALGWGFYTNFEGMTDNFWVFADTLYNLWTDVIFPVIKAFMGALKLLGSALWLAIVWLWENILKSAFEDIAGAFNNVVLAVTYLLNIFIDFWNFISPVLIPILVVLAIIFGGVLFLKILAVIGIAVLLFKVFSLVVKLIGGFIWVIIEAIKFLGGLAGSLWEATHEGESFAESWYNSSLVVGESGGIFAHITDMLVILGGAIQWVGKWFEWLALSTANVALRIAANMKASVLSMMANIRYTARGSDEGETPAETYWKTKEKIDAQLKEETTQGQGLYEKPDVEFFAPFMKAVALGATATVAVGMTAAAIAALPYTGGASGLALASVPYAVGLTGAYFTAQPLANALRQSQQSSFGPNGLSAQDLKKAEYFQGFLQFYKDNISKSVGVQTLFGDRGVNSEYKGNLVEPVSNKFLAEFANVLAIGSDSSLAAADRAEAVGKAEQEARMKETEEKYKESLKGKTPSEVAALEKQYKAYLTEEEKIASGFKMGLFRPAPIAPVDPFTDKAFTPTYGPINRPNRVVAPPMTQTQYQADSSRTEADLGARLVNIQNTIYTTSQTILNARTTAGGGAGAAPAQNYGPFGR